MKAKKPNFASIMLPAVLAELAIVGTEAATDELLGLTPLMDEEDATVGMAVGELRVVITELPVGTGNVPEAMEVPGNVTPEDALSQTPVFTFGQQGSLTINVQLLGHDAGHCGTTAGAVHALIHAVGTAVREKLVSAKH
ncbi:hypothetical protein INT44_005000 [Umbelopsis vinacea]|uniref:Uncharacterized protein n=1 Tax=Umbelopsis vinacea TaxID=44442 RepID=A0A8H7Q858_9FUNG|nr:hypothetical protein INT44_005000 [Umbelopsis vinacea]